MERAVNNESGDKHIYCNSCGKKLKVENGILKRAFEATKNGDTFLPDTQIHRFNL